jgi:hypothetical protein
MEPRNRFPAWKAGTTTLFFVPARPATWGNRFLGIDSELHKRLQIRALCAATAQEHLPGRPEEPHAEESPHRRSYQAKVRH